MATKYPILVVTQDIHTFITQRINEFVPACMNIHVTTEIDSNHTNWLTTICHFYIRSSGFKWPSENVEGKVKTKHKKHLGFNFIAGAYDWTADWTAMV